MRNEDLSSFYESAFPGDSSSGPSSAPSIGLVLLASSGQEERGDDYSVDTDATGPPPPLGVKLTVYRLLNVTVLFSFGITKSILAYQGEFTAPTTLDWVGGTLLMAVLYWISLYEDTKKWEWFFHVDLAPATGYCAKRVVGGFLFVLFFCNGVYVATLLGCSSLLPLCDLLLHHLNWWQSVAEGRSRHANLALFGIIIGSLVGPILSLILLFAGVGVLTRRVRARLWAWQRVMRFVDDYGPTAPLAEGYGWIGRAGTIVGFCGFSLFFSPLVVIPVFYLMRVM